MASYTITYERVLDLGTQTNKKLMIIDNDNPELHNGNCISNCPPGCHKTEGKSNEQAIYHPAASLNAATNSGLSPGLIYPQ